MSQSRATLKPDHSNVPVGSRCLFSRNFGKVTSVWMQLTTPPFSFVLGIGKLNSQEFSITCGTRIRVKIHIRKILWRGEVTKVMQWSLARQCVASKKKYFQCRHHFLPILWWGKCKDIKIGPHPQCHIECLDFDIWEKEQKNRFSLLDQRRDTLSLVQKLFGVKCLFFAQVIWKSCSTIRGAIRL